MISILNMDSILTNIDINNKEEALRKIAHVAQNLNVCKDEKRVYNALLKREDECSTNVGLGVAIPHIKNDCIKEASLVILKSNRLFNWEGGDKVNIIISILAPEETDSNLHLKLLSKLSRKLIDKDYKNSLAKSVDKKTIYKLIESALCS